MLELNIPDQWLEKGNGAKATRTSSALDLIRAAQIFSVLRIE